LVEGVHFKTYFATRGGLPVDLRFKAAARSTSMTKDTLDWDSDTDLEGREAMVALVSDAPTPGVMPGRTPPFSAPAAKRHPSIRNHMEGATAGLHSDTQYTETVDTQVTNRPGTGAHTKTDLLQ
jgi:hypothetical protein